MQQHNADVSGHASFFFQALKIIIIFPPYEIVKTADGQMASLVSMHLEI